MTNYRILIVVITLHSYIIVNLQQCIDDVYVNGDVCKDLYTIAPVTCARELMP